MGTKGKGAKTYELYEELPMLLVTPYAEIPYIYKRLDVEVNKPMEERKYQIRNLVFA
tara:strand:- start:555 stop:725 length:171 start_codon:yes stop_codon:yes gene_type:complete